MTQNCFVCYSLVYVCRSLFFVSNFLRTFILFLILKVGFDNERSISLKVKWAASLSLGGKLFKIFLEKSSL